MDPDRITPAAGPRRTALLLLFIVTIFTVGGVASAGGLLPREERNVALHGIVALLALVGSAFAGIALWNRRCPRMAAERVGELEADIREPGHA